MSTKSARAETTNEIAGCAAAMRDHATRVETGMDLFEIVGTGGVKTDHIFDLVRDLRGDVTMPMVFMTYARSSNCWKNTEKKRRTMSALT